MASASLDLFFLVRLAGGEEDDEEGEEQSDEVGVGDEPALVVDVFGMLLFAHALDLGAARSEFGGFGVEEIGAEFGLDHARVHAFEDGDDAFEHHLLDHLLFAVAEFEFAGGGKADEVGDGDSVDGGDEGDGDAATDLVDVGEVLHDLDEAEDGADDADGGRVAACGFEDCGDFFFDLGFVVELELHDLADLAGLGAVDGEHEGLLEEGIGDGGEIGVERDDAALAGFVGEGDDLREDGFAVGAFVRGRL